MNRENVEVVVGDNEAGGKSATITDRKAGRAWSGEGDTESKATTEAMRKFLGDRRVREYTHEE